MNGTTQRQILSLPMRDWKETKTYDSILVTNTKRKSETGFAVMAIIGCVNRKPVEIAAYCDDIEWKMNEVSFDKIRNDFRNDMIYPCGAIHFWSKSFKYEVGRCLSSTDVTLKPSN